jgi:hypothetical protein
MTNAWTPLPSHQDGHFARDFIPDSHRELLLLRIFLPLLQEERRPVRWSTFMSLDHEPASLSWRELVDRVADHHPEIHRLVSCAGVLDAATAEALHDAIGNTELNSLRWDGYGDNTATATPIRVYENEYSLAHLPRTALRAGERLPEFVWDDAGTFAWGTRLYPDSLIVACEPDRFTELHADPRLDTVTVRPERDILPASFGD